MNETKEPNPFTHTYMRGSPLTFHLKASRLFATNHSVFFWGGFFFFLFSFFERFLVLLGLPSIHPSSYHFQMLLDWGRPYSFSANLDSGISFFQTSRRKEMCRQKKAQGPTYLGLLLLASFARNE